MLRAASSLSSLLLLLLVLLLVLVLVLVRVVVVLVVVLVVILVVVVVGLVVVLVVVSVVAVVVVVVIVVIAVAAWSCGRCRCYLCSWYFFANPSKSSNRRFLQTPKKRQIGGVFAIFHILGTKKHRKYRCFWLRANAKPWYLRGFEPLRAKITVFTVFCGPGLAKTLVFTQFPACCQKLFFGCHRHKNIVNYTIFTRGQYQKIMTN